MTLVRKLALSISNRVVRWSSPGCKEWAEGLEREVAFIEKDWAALAWAIGSLRVVPVRLQAPIGSLAEVPAAAMKLVETMRGGYGMWLVIFQGPQYTWMLFTARTWGERVGCALVVLSSIVAGSLLLMDRRRLKAPYKDDVYDDDVACAQFYRAELERRRWTLWIPMACLMCYVAGLALGQRGGIRAHPGLCALWVLVLPVIPWAFAQARRNNTARIERLDALLAENIGATSR
jgi:hypothetical protein